MVASEAAPFAKTGGLADVVGSLPAALAGLGHQVAVVLPRYAAIDLEIRAARLRQSGYLVRPGPLPHYALRDRRQATFYFVDCPELYDREGLYGDADGRLSR